MATKTYNVVAQRENGSGYLLTEEDLRTLDPATAKVIQYEPAKKLGWVPQSLQSYLGRGYWVDPKVDTIDADIQNWQDPAKPRGAKKEGE